MRRGHRHGLALRARSALLAAILAALLYAAFAAGAARQPGETWFEIAVAALALLAAASALLGGALAGRAPRAAWWGVGLLALFVAWTGVSLTWSIAPDRTWADFNRVLAYALIAMLGVIAGASIPRVVERFAAGFLAVVSIVALYALAGKVAPGVVDHTEQVARLRAPLEYWNALGLLCVLAVPIAVRLAVDAARGTRSRLAALAALYLLAIVVGLTYSRGAVAAFLIAAAVLTVFGRGRLRGVVALGAAAAAAAVPLGFAFTRTALTDNGADLGARISGGRILGVLVLVAGVALLAGGRALLRLEPRVNWSAERTHRTLRLAAAGAGVLLVAGAFGLTRSQEGFRGTISQTVESFTEVREDRQYDPVRLLSTNSGNRVSWWKEAAGAWSDRPVQGWGGGSFALLHLRYRQDTLPVTQAHSMPLQLLAETGLVGLVLAYGAILALLAAAIARVRRMEERGLAVALLAAVAAWLVHGVYDWDFQIPAVTAPVLFMLGLLAGCAAPRGPQDAAIAALAPPRFTTRAPLVGLAAVLAAAVVVSAALPWLAARKADHAAELSADRSEQALQDAAAEADLAARLNPLATRPLFVAAAVAAARERLLEARAHLLEAADRAPDDPQVWGRLASLALQLADRQGYLQATERIFVLDPLNPVAEGQLATALQLLTPPASSATSTGTPLVHP